MQQQVVAAKTVEGLASLVNRLFGDGWRWVDGGGSVAMHAIGAQRKTTGGFYAVLEKEEEASQPPAGFVKEFP